MTDTYSIGLLLGDGIGPEVVRATQRVIDAALEGQDEVDVAWIELPMGAQAIDEFGSSLPAETTERLTTCDGWIMGPHDNASYPPEDRKHRNPSAELRHHFDLYANIRPAKSVGAMSAIRDDVDLVIVRENTEGFYSDRNLYWGHGELMPTPDVALTLGVFTRAAITRIAHTAFALAARRRNHLTVVHKANVLQRSSGMYVEVCRELAQLYPDVVVDDRHVDAMAALLVRCPSDFDVVVTENLFGDILSDLASEVVGSVGCGAAINAGRDHAMAQASHGAAPALAGRDIANPAGEILSGAMLLEWMGDRRGSNVLIEAADSVKQAVG
ncbi:MAG: 3-isopropylmalate dehydrogenase, partial [Micromonosporaceae bacterium]|nr:3-isopropylmalate dehydrogenase [Micromonosporaceae bacterium]